MSYVFVHPFFDCWDVSLVGSLFGFSFGFDFGLGLVLVFQGGGSSVLQLTL